MQHYMVDDNIKRKEYEKKKKINRLKFVTVRKKYRSDRDLIEC